MCFVGCDPDDLVDGVSNRENIVMGYTFREANVTYSGISEGSTATYTPHEGYSLSIGSSAMRTCQNNGLWSGSVPTFEKG